MVRKRNPILTETAAAEESAQKEQAASERLSGSDGDLG
jgi:hypothetical protein